MNEIVIQRPSPIQQLKESESRLQKRAEESQPGEFEKALEGALKEVDQAQKASNEQIQKMLAGDIQDVHSAMIAVQKADLSFQMMMQVRNKLIDAYHEIMRMQV